VPHLLPYSTAKFGAVGFATGLRAELAGSGVTVTTIAPGLMRTGSHVQAEFVGDPAREYAWFAPSASLPVLAMDAERAAARMVDAVLAGRSMLVLTWLAKLGRAVNGLAPRTTAVAMGAAARLLPAAPTGSRPGFEAPAQTVTGWTARERLSPVAGTVVRGLSRLGERAIGRYNQRR
jgi:hypothetical protein